MLRGLDGYLLILVVGQLCGFQAPAWTRRRPLTLFGGHSEGETPLPIPNRAVKPLRADGTWPSRAWESRSPPNYLRATGRPERAARGRCGAARGRCGAACGRCVAGPRERSAALRRRYEEALTIGGVSVLAIVLIVLFALIVVFLVGGYMVAKRRANRPG